MKPQRTILVTFAGRRDRMELLTRYVDAAINRGLIDEWHVWEFSRTAEDARWLREKFPLTQATPNRGSEFFRLPRTLSAETGSAKLSLQVRASHDVHIGLRRLTGSSGSYEIVLGGWNNQLSAIRRFDDPALLTNVDARHPQHPASVARNTPDLLPEFGFSSVDIEIGADGLRVLFAGALLLHEPNVAPGEFEVLYRTGYGANGDWRFAGMEDVPARLFVSGPESYFAAGSVFYTMAYQYYAATREEYESDIILKCDDDIVYFDLDQLADFVSFRKANDAYFLVSANVVNNGVCAYFQQAMGAISREAMECELPEGGFGGSIWRDGAKAEALHRLFLSNPAAFHVANAGTFAWNERISINFIALLGRDLVHVPDIMADDEHDLCYGVRKRAKKQNCIYLQFVVSHLSFGPQDAAMDVRAVIEGYDALAVKRLAASA
jgi:Farnesoic acid 0-methyl transferase